VAADALASDASVPSLFYAVSATLADPTKKLDGAATLKTLQAALKKDDSLPNLGFAFQVCDETTLIEAVLVKTAKACCCKELPTNRSNTKQSRKQYLFNLTTLIVVTNLCLVSLVNLEVRI
jgi:hypothetical protein